MLTNQTTALLYSHSFIETGIAIRFATVSSFWCKVSPIWTLYVLLGTYLENFNCKIIWGPGYCGTTAHLDVKNVADCTNQSCHGMTLNLPNKISVSVRFKIGASQDDKVPLLICVLTVGQTFSAFPSCLSQFEMTTSDLVANTTVLFQPKSVKSGFMSLQSRTKLWWYGWSHACL